MLPAGWGVVLLSGVHGWIGSQPVEPSYKASLLPHPAPNASHVPAGTTPTLTPTLGWQEARVQDGTGPQKVLENPDTQQGGLSSPPGQVLGFGPQGVDWGGPGWNLGRQCPCPAVPKSGWRPPLPSALTPQEAWQVVSAPGQCWASREGLSLVTPNPQGATRPQGHLLHLWENRGFGSLGTTPWSPTGCGVKLRAPRWGGSAGVTLAAEDHQERLGPRLGLSLTSARQRGL